MKAPKSHTGKAANRARIASSAHFAAAVVATHRRAAALTRLPCALCRNVPHHLGQLAGTDFVEEAVELDVLRHRRARTKQRDIMLERHLEIHDGKAIVIKHRRDISVTMIVELLYEQLGRQSRRAAERVVNHDDILNAEYIVHGRHGL